jgi:hypothetical protein
MSPRKGLRICTTQHHERGDYIITGKGCPREWEIIKNIYSFLLCAGFPCWWSREKWPGGKCRFVTGSPYEIALVVKNDAGNDTR